MAESFPVGQAPWEVGEAKQSFPVGQAPWEMEKPGPGKLITAVEHFGNGLTLGYGAHAQAAVEKAMDEVGIAKDAALDSLGLDKLASLDHKLAKQGFKIPERTYVQARDENLLRMDRETMANPKTAYLSDLAGGIIGGSAIGGGAPLKGAGAVKNIVDMARQGAAVGTVVGAVANPGDIPGEVNPIQAKERLENAVVGGVTGGVLGGGLTTIAEGIRGTPEAVKPIANWAQKKAGKIFASVPEETTTRYIENKNVINNAPERQQLSQQIVDMRDEAAEKLSAARDKLLEAKSKLSEKKIDIRGELQDENYNVRKDTQSAQDEFNQAKDELRDTMKQHNMTGLATTATRAVGELESQVRQGSTEGFDILGKSRAKVSIDPLNKALQRTIKDLQINGVPKSPAASATIEYLKGEQQRLWDMTLKTDGKLTMSQAKEMLMAMDNQTTYAKGKGEFSTELNDAIKGIRRDLDEMVKDKVPEYREHMKGLRDKTQLLSKVAELYGTPEKAITNLNGIDSEKGQAVHTPLLRDLDKQVGTKLASAADSYIYNSKILSNKTAFNRVLEETPEFTKLLENQSKAEKIRNPEYARSKSESAIAPLEKGLSNAESGVEEAKNNAALFKGVTADTVTGKQKQLGGANNFAAEKRFKAIDEAKGTTLERDIRARNDKEAFEKTDTQGSRKTLWGAILGGVIGYAMDHPVEGTAIGSSIGQAADKYSGQMFKWQLDKSMSALDAAEKIGKAIGDRVDNISPAVAGGATAAKMTSDRRRTGEDKWAVDGYEKIASHLKMDSTNDPTSVQTLNVLMKDPKIKKLLIQASEMKPGSKAMDNILSEIKQRASKGGR